ncbi:hypothetical protein GCM10010346_41360 [Streptomyces chryseus]|uniref:Uncharacterized protein n=1 Tax=Streptomyces chryseus TaxID=68186 RepID=A0ABQ3DRT7_9ACTN|nr:hypothetical protein GCM10010346_41360 [Streptomyces chryseus]
MTDMPDILVVRTVVDEDAQRYADLVGREADSLGGVHRREHVLDEADERGTEVAHRPTGRVQRRVTEQCHGSYEPGTAGNRAVSHGGKRTFRRGPRRPRRCRGAGARLVLDRLSPDVDRWTWGKCGAGCKEDQ